MDPHNPVMALTGYRPHGARSPCSMGVNNNGTTSPKSRCTSNRVGTPFTHSRRPIELLSGDCAWPAVPRVMLGSVPFFFCYITPRWSPQKSEL